MCVGFNTRYRNNFENKLSINYFFIQKVKEFKMVSHVHMKGKYSQKKIVLALFMHD